MSPLMKVRKSSRICVVCGSTGVKPSTCFTITLNVSYMDVEPKIINICVIKPYDQHKRKREKYILIHDNISLKNTFLASSQKMTCDLSFQE